MTVIITHRLYINTQSENGCKNVYLHYLLFFYLSTTIMCPKLFFFLYKNILQSSIEVRKTFFSPLAHFVSFQHQPSSGAALLLCAGHGELKCLAVRMQPGSWPSDKASFTVTSGRAQFTLRWLSVFTRLVFTERHDLAPVRGQCPRCSRTHSRTQACLCTCTLAAHTLDRHIKLLSLS